MSFTVPTSLMQEIGNLFDEEDEVISDNIATSVRSSSSSSSSSSSVVIDQPLIRLDDIESVGGGGGGDGGSGGGDGEQPTHTFSGSNGAAGSAVAAQSTRSERVDLLRDQAHDIELHAAVDDLNVPVMPISIPAVHSSAQASGHDAKEFRIEGLTMRVKNPRFEEAQEQYNAMTRRMRVNQIARDQARQWVLDSERIPTVGLQNDPSLNMRIESIDQDIRDVLLNASYVRKPPDIAAKRNEYFVENITIRSLAPIVEGSFINGLVATAIATPLETQFTVEDRQATFEERYQATVALGDAVRQRFSVALATSDYSEFPVTREELKNVFDAHLVDEVLRIRREKGGDEMLPFGAESDYDRDQRTQYNAETVQASVVPDMTEWLDAWITDARKEQLVRRVPVSHKHLGDALREHERQRLIVYVNTLVYGEGVPKANPMPHVALLGKTIPSDDDIISRFNEAVKSTFELEAFTAGLLPPPPELTDENVNAVVALARSRIYSIDPTEEALQTRRVRVLMEANTIRRATEAQLALLDYETRRKNLTPTIEVPMVVRRESTSAESFILTATLAEVLPGDDAQASNIDGEYEFRWYYRPFNGSGDNEVMMQLVTLKDELPTDTYRVQPNPAPSSGAYVGGIQAGLYRVEIDRDGGASNELEGGGTTFTSDYVSLHVDAECQRCSVRFEVGAGAPRHFGECEWRSKPIDKMMLDYRRRREFSGVVAAFGSPAGGGAGSGNGYDWRADLDDSIISHRTSTLVIDDKSLIELSTMGNRALADRYFEWESVVENVAKRLPRAMLEKYGTTAYEAAQRLFIDRMPIAGQRTAEALVIGMVYASVDPPAETAMFAAEDALEPVARALQEATAFSNQKVAEKAPTAELEAARGAMLRLQSEADAADRFRVDVLQGLARRIDELDSRLSLARGSVMASADRASTASSLDELPLSGVINVMLLPSNPLAVTKSERRFAASVASRFGAFTELYRANAETMTNISEADRRRIRLTGKSLVVIGARPMLSKYREPRAPTGDVVALNQTSQGIEKDRRDLQDAEASRARLAATAPFVDRQYLQKAEASRARLATKAPLVDVTTGRIVKPEVALRSAESELLDARTSRDDKRIKAAEKALSSIEARVAERAKADGRVADARRRVQIREANIRAPLIRVDPTVVQRESVRVADAQLAGMTASDVRTSEAWRFASMRSLGLAEEDAFHMFQDRHGAKRLAERMAAATVRTNIETRTQKFIDESYTDVGELARNDMELAAALGKPLGVEQSLWLHLGDLVARNGVAATAEVARGISRVGGLERALGTKDWRGYHSETDQQPDIYDVAFTEPLDQPGSQASRRRGSERLAAGYDFTSLNRRIERLIGDYNRVPSKEVRERIQRLAFYFNALAQFAPKLRSTAVFGVDEIEKAMLSVTQQTMPDPRGSLGDPDAPVPRLLPEQVAANEAKRRRVERM